MSPGSGLMGSQEKVLSPENRRDLRKNPSTLQDPVCAKKEMDQVCLQDGNKTVKE